MLSVVSVKGSGGSWPPGKGSVPQGLPMPPFWAPPHHLAAGSCLLPLRAEALGQPCPRTQTQRNLGSFRSRQEAGRRPQGGCKQTRPGEGREKLLWHRPQPQGGQRAALKNPLGYGEPRPEGCGAGSGGAAAASSAELGSPLASAWGWAGPGPSSPTAPSPKAAGCEARPGAGELGGMGASWRGDARRRYPEHPLHPSAREPPAAMWGWG